jgi:CxxC motif-containing protein (DUF1111 family)
MRSLDDLNVAFLVGGMGLIEAIPVRAILVNADPDEDDGLLKSMGKVSLYVSIIYRDRFMR